ncbi:MAG: protein kinase, partial [Gemmataceae bacterium]
MNPICPEDGSALKTITASPLDQQTQMLRLKQDQLRKRWAQGEQLGAEALFDEEMDRDTQLRLVMAELLLRAEYSQPIELNDLLRRFPQFSAELRYQVDFLRMISGQCGSTWSYTVPRIPHAVATIQIPGYQVQQLIARGGMGAVYLAWEEKLKRLVALKLMLQGDAYSPDKLERFRQEAQAVAQLQHPHVVQIYQVERLKL